MQKLANCTLKKGNGQRQECEKLGFEVEESPQKLKLKETKIEKLEEKVKKIAEHYDGILLGGGLQKSITIFQIALKYNIPCYTIEERTLIQVQVRTCLSGCYLPLSMEFGQADLCPKCGNQIGTVYKGGKVDENTP